MKGGQGSWGDLLIAWQRTLGLSRVNKALVHTILACGEGLMGYHRHVNL